MLNDDLKGLIEAIDLSKLKGVESIDESCLTELIFKGNFTQLGVEVVEDDRVRDDDCDSWQLIFQYKGRLYASYAGYSSYDGVDNDWSDLVEVKPVEKTIIVYEAV